MFVVSHGMLTFYSALNVVLHRDSDFWAPVFVASCPRGALEVTNRWSAPNFNLLSHRLLTEKLSL